MISGELISDDFAVIIITQIHFVDGYLSFRFRFQPIHITAIIKTHLSHCRNVHDAIIHSETINTNNTVPGHIVINVFKTNLKELENENMRKELRNLRRLAELWNYRAWTKRARECGESVVVAMPTDIRSIHNIPQHSPPDLFSCQPVIYNRPGRKEKPLT